MMIILAHCGNGYTGCDSEEAFFYEDDIFIEDIKKDIYQWAVENAESFAHVHFGWDTEYSDEDWEDYINDIDFNWHDATYGEYVEWCENWGYEPKVFK